MALQCATESPHSQTPTIPKFQCMCVLAGCAWKGFRVVLISSRDIDRQRNIQTVRLASRHIGARDIASSRQRQLPTPHFGLHALFGALHSRIPRRLLTCTCRVASSSRAVPLGNFSTIPCAQTDYTPNDLTSRSPLTARCLAALVGASLLWLHAQPSAAGQTALVRVSVQLLCASSIL